MVGCSNGVNEELITVDASNDPLFEPRSILQRYANGQAMGSEQSNFDNLVKMVRETDPTAADALAEGFDELKKASPAARKNKAKEILAKIAPKVGGPGDN